MNQRQERIGFVGLGVMGQPMALNLAKAGTPLVVWNRSIEPTQALQAVGAQVVDSIDGVFQHAKIVIVMLVDSDAIDEVLGRGTAAFNSRVAGHILVSMSSVSPEYSRELAADIRLAGGRYVEAPVSGSRKPAEHGQLVSLLGGTEEDVQQVMSVLTPMCKEVLHCGQVEMHCS